MSYTKVQLEKLTTLAANLQTDTALLAKFAKHMLDKYPNEALRFIQDVPKPVYRPVVFQGSDVSPAVQEWVNTNATKFNNYKYSSDYRAKPSPKIEAIKALRTEFRLGLKQAKDALEGYPYQTY